MSQIGRHLALLIALGVAWPVAAGNLWERKWVEVRSPHFLIVSALSKKDTSRLAREMENFRIVVKTVANVDYVDDRIPMTAYVLPYMRDEFGVEMFGGVAARLDPLEGLRSNYAVVFQAPRPYGHVGQLKHDYVYFLLRNGKATGHPLWFDEGLAWMLQTLEVKEDRVEYGNSPPASANFRVERTNEGALCIGLCRRVPGWMPYATVLDARGLSGINAAQRWTFYTQAWMLVHYLTLGRTDRNLDSDYRTYVQLSEAGTERVKTFEEAFGLTVSDLQVLLSHYTKRLPVRTIPLSKALPKEPLQVRLLPADLVAAQLGQLLIRYGELEEAKRYFDAALVLNADNAAALAGIGDLLRDSDRFAEAPAYYERAIALEPENAWHELDYGEYFLTRAQKATEEVQRRQQLRSARAHFARSYALDGNDPETLAMNGSSYLFAGESNAKALESLQAADRMLPSNRKIQMLLARAYVDAGEKAAAIALLRLVVMWSDDATSTSARQLLDELQDAVPRADAPVLP